MAGHAGGPGGEEAPHRSRLTRYAIDALSSGPCPQKVCLSQRDAPDPAGRGLGKLSSEWKGEAADPTLNFPGREVKSVRKYSASGLLQALQGAALGGINQRGKEAGRWEDGWAWGALTRKVCFLGMTTF